MQPIPAEFPAVCPCRGFCTGAACSSFTLLQISATDLADLFGRRKAKADNPMLFTSLEFLFLFLPIVLAVNYFLPKGARNYWLLLASLFFYAWGEPKFVIFMLISILFNYLMAYRISDFHSRHSTSGDILAKLFLTLTVIGNLSVLFVYKYMNFTTSILSKLLPEEEIVVTEFVLPIGISFFTFQALSYVIDVYRGVEVQKNPAKIGLYISLFPQLIAGPIVRYTTVQKQIDDRTVTYDSFAKGVFRFVRGFNKKVLLSNMLAVVADAAWGMPERSVAMAWMGAIGYSLQIFFDFSGYSEMAIGLGQMLGFQFLENFNFPYIAKTVSEFWRRWHISLGTWFRDYVYFPLGGSRVSSRGRLIFNLSVVWLLTGIWHGANWTFLVWGALYGAFIIFEKLVNLEKHMDRWHPVFRVLYRILTLAAVLFGWVIFRSESLGQAGQYILSMFALTGNAFSDGQTLFYLRNHIVFFIVGILCSMPLFRYIRTKLGQRMDPVCSWISYIVQFLLLLCSVSYLVIQAHNPFIYFNF